MSKRHGSMDDKSLRTFAKKRIRELAENDYVDGSAHRDMADSDVEAPAGRSISDSETEGRDASIVKSFARASEEDHEFLRAQLLALPLAEIVQVAEKMGVAEAENYRKEHLIEEILDRQVYPATIGF